MSLSDYAHWNEEATIVWWQEEGRHPYEDECGDYDDADDYIHSYVEDDDEED